MNRYPHKNKMPTITVNFKHSLLNENQSALWLRACWSLLLEKTIVPKSSGKLTSKAALVAEINKLIWFLPEKNCDLYAKLMEGNHTIEYSC
jgi:hypothetical protein